MTKLLQILNYIDLHASRHGFRPKTEEPFLRSEFMVALNLDMLDASRSPNADSPPFDDHGKAEEENVKN